MSNVQIDINGRRYGIGCDDGQEEHITKLARHFDNHVRNLVQNVGQIGEQRLFLMAALLLADESHELKIRLDQTEAELARLRDSRPTPEQMRNAAELDQKANNTLVEAMNIENEASEALKGAAQYFADAAQRIESLAKKIV